MEKIQSKGEFKDILSSYDIILFDIYGVAWNGIKCFDGTKETLQFLKEQNKIVYFVSNSPEILMHTTIERFKKAGIKEGEDYNEIISSGMVLNSMVEQDGSLDFDGKKLNKCFTFGKVKHPERHIKFNQVNDVKNADFVFASYPVFTQEEYDNFSDNEKQYLIKSFTVHDCYESLIPDLYLPKLKEIVKYNLPMISNCSDMVAQAPTDNGDIAFVIRQGTILSLYKNLGGVVFDVSKPSSAIYRYVFDVIKAKYGFAEEQLKNKKIAMIGDTIHTDILGATNATNELNINVDGILTLCGVSALDFKNNEQAIEQYCKDNNLKLNYTIDSLGVIL